MSPSIAFWPRIGRKWLTAVALLLGVHAAPLDAQAKAGGASPEDSLRALESARGQALLHADTTTLSRMIADEFIEVTRFGTIRTKADNIREIATGALKLKTVSYDSVSVRVYGDVAVLRGIADNTGSFRGFGFSGKLWYTRIFVRRDGRWQAVAMQHTPIP